MLTIQKRYDDFPAAHRQHTHGGHCRFIHGHNWSFEFVFSAKELDANGFIVDFGALKWLREWLDEQFDHTLLLAASDPFVDHLRGELQRQLHPDIAGVFCELADLRILPAVSAEGLAAFVFGEVSIRIFRLHAARVRLVSVTVYEDNKNSATYAQE